MSSSSNRDRFNSTSNTGSFLNPKTSTLNVSPIPTFDTAHKRFVKRSKKCEQQGPSPLLSTSNNNDQSLLCQPQMMHRRRSISESSIDRAPRADSTNDAGGTFKLPLIKHQHSASSSAEVNHQIAGNKANSLLPPVAASRFGNGSAQMTDDSIVNGTDGSYSESGYQTRSLVVVCMEQSSSNVKETSCMSSASASGTETEKTTSRSNAAAGLTQLSRIDLQSPSKRRLHSLDVPATRHAHQHQCSTPKRQSTNPDYDNTTNGTPNMNMSSVLLSASQTPSRIDTASFANYIPTSTGGSIVNPFESCLLDSMLTQTCSPSAFKYNSPSSADREKDETDWEEAPQAFRWSIDHMAQMNPAVISHEDVVRQEHMLTSLNAEDEQVLQSAINEFFSSAQLPSPADSAHSVGSISRFKQFVVDRVDSPNSPAAQMAAYFYEKHVFRQEHHMQSPLSSVFASRSVKPEMKKSPLANAYNAMMNENDENQVVGEASDAPTHDPNKQSCTMATQTQLTFPAKLDLIELLAPYFQYDEQTEDSADSLMDVSMNSLRRKLFGAGMPHPYRNARRGPTMASHHRNKDVLRATDNQLQAVSSVSCTELASTRTPPRRRRLNNSLQTSSFLSSTQIDDTQMYTSAQEDCFGDASLVEPDAMMIEPSLIVTSPASADTDRHTHRHNSSVFEEDADHLLATALKPNQSTNTVGHSHTNAHSMRLVSSPSPLQHSHPTHKKTDRTGLSAVGKVPNLHNVPCTTYQMAGPRASHDGAEPDVSMMSPNCSLIATDDHSTGPSPPPDVGAWHEPDLSPIKFG